MFFRLIFLFFPNNFLSLFFFFLFVLFLLFQERWRPKAGLFLFLLSGRGHFSICGLWSVSFAFWESAVSVGFFTIKCMVTCITEKLAKIIDLFLVSVHCGFIKVISCSFPLCLVCYLILPTRDHSVLLSWKNNEKDGMPINHIVDNLGFFCHFFGNQNDRKIVIFPHCCES